MQLHSKAVAILILFLFLIASIIPGMADNKIIASNAPTEQPEIFWLYTGWPAYVWIEIDWENNTIAFYVYITEPGYTFCMIGFGSGQLCCTDYCVWYFKAEGTITFHYWWIDKEGNSETPHTVTLTLDWTPPVVTGFTEPQQGGLYLFGNFIMQGKLGTTTLCIGKVPVAVTATDEGGSGVKMILFSFSDGQTAFDDTPGDGFTTTWRGRNFGDLTITAKARDGKGLESAPQSMTITVYSLGLF